VVRGVRSAIAEAASLVIAHSPQAAVIFDEEGVTLPVHSHGGNTIGNDQFNGFEVGRSYVSRFVAPLLAQLRRVRVLFEFVLDLLQSLIVSRHCMRNVSSPQAAIALDEETDAISGGNLDYALPGHIKCEE
jgi:hypothetical protein